MERQGLTLIPLELYFRGGVAKVSLALGKGKKLHDKRADDRKRTDERDMARVARGAMIVAFALLLQQALAQPLSSVTVRNGDEATTVSVIAASTVARSVQADALADGARQVRSRLAHAMSYVVAVAGRSRGVTRACHSCASATRRCR